MTVHRVNIYNYTMLTIYVFCTLIVITGFETENKYRVRNSVGQQIYFAAEGIYKGFPMPHSHMFACRIQLLFATVLWAKQAICHGHH